MIKDIFEFAKEIFIFMKANPGVGLKIAGAVAVVIILIKLINSKKFHNWIRKFGKGIGVTISKFLMAKLGATLAEWVEQLLINIRTCIGILLDSIIEGLREDNQKKKSAIKVKGEKKATKIAEKAEVRKFTQAKKAEKLKRKVKGRSNL